MGPEMLAINLQGYRNGVPECSPYLNHPGWGVTRGPLLGSGPLQKFNQLSAAEGSQSPLPKHAFCICDVWLIKAINLSAGGSETNAALLLLD